MAWPLDFFMKYSVQISLREVKRQAWGHSARGQGSWVLNLGRRGYRV